MKYVKFYLSNGYAGCDNEQYEQYDDDVDERVIDYDLTERATENGEQYLWCATGWEEDWESEEDEEFYWQDCLENSSWEYISKEEYEENVNN